VITCTCGVGTGFGRASHDPGCAIHAVSVGKLTADTVTGTITVPGFADVYGDRMREEAARRRREGHPVSSAHVRELRQSVDQIIAAALDAQRRLERVAKFAADRAAFPRVETDWGTVAADLRAVLDGVVR
jgi:hypothetical protein